MRKILSSIIATTLGLWLATLFVPGVYVRLLTDSTFFGFHLTAIWQIYLLLGITLGLLKFFTQFLPFQLIINLAFIWVIDILFREFSAPLLFPFFWTTIIIWILNILLSKSILKHDD